VEVEVRVLDAFDVNFKHEVYISPRVVDRSILSDPVWSVTPFLQALAKEGIALRNGNLKNLRGIVSIVRRKHLPKANIF
jgi:hypothetical protein